MSDKSFDFYPGMIIVYFEENVSLEQAKEICTSNGGTFLEYFDVLNGASVSVPNGAEEEFARTFSGLPGVADTELNYGWFAPL